jgi:hypothetical protein
MEISMSSKTASRRIVIGLVAVYVAVVVVGCVGSKGAKPVASKSDQPVLASSESDKGASQLWAENCNRCHNYRPASTYNDYQWTIVMQHMRVRANLTAQEQKQILEFLQASN